MSDTPSLQDIADMPLQEGLKAIRENYDPNWGVENAKGAFYVDVNYYVKEHEYHTFEVFASTKDQALEMVKKEIKRISFGDVEIDTIDVLENNPGHFHGTLGGDNE